MHPKSANGKRRWIDWFWFTWSLTDHWQHCTSAEMTIMITKRIEMLLWHVSEMPPMCFGMKWFMFGCQFFQNSSSKCTTPLFKWLFPPSHQICNICLIASFHVIIVAESSVWRRQVFLKSLRDMQQMSNVFSWWEGRSWWCVDNFARMPSTTFWFQKSNGMLWVLDVLWSFETNWVRQFFKHAFGTRMKKNLGQGGQMCTVENNNSQANEHQLLLRDQM